MSTAFEMPETMDFINDLFNDAAPPMPEPEQPKVDVVVVVKEPRTPHPKPCWKRSANRIATSATAKAKLKTARAS